MGKFSQFKLQLKSLPEGTDVQQYHLDKTFFSNMENTDVRDADLNVVLTTVYHAGIYDLHFEITGNVTLLCDRCLDDLIVPIEASYKITVKYGDDFNDESDDLLILPESDNYLNVAYMIYDTVMLAIPIKHVHPMGKCNRAMSSLLKKHRAHSAADSADDTLIEDLVDGIDDMEPEQPRETDPRWDALKNLTDNQE